MKFLQFETNSLSTLAEDLQGAEIWGKIGTSAKMINLHDLAVGLMNPETKKISYVLPVVNEAQAGVFQTECNQYGITVNIIEEATAQVKVDALKVAIEASKA